MGWLIQSAKKIISNWMIRSLITLDVPVNPSYKKFRPEVANRSTKNPQSKTEHHCVAKIKARLEEAWHLGLDMIVIDRVQIYINGSGCSWEEWSPLPVVVLSIQQEIRSNNCHTHSDYDQNQKDKQHEAVNIVHLVVPKGSEDKIHLNENTSEGKQSTHQRYDWRC